MVPTTLMHVLFGIRPLKTAKLVFKRTKEAEEETIEEAKVTRVELYLGREKVLSKETDESFWNTGVSGDSRITVHVRAPTDESVQQFCYGLPLGALYHDTVMIHVHYECPKESVVRKEVITREKLFELEMIGCLYKDSARQLATLCGNYCLPIMTAPHPKWGDTRLFVSELLKAAYNSNLANNLLVIKKGKAKLMFNDDGTMATGLSLT